MPVVPPPLIALGAGFVQRALAPEQPPGLVRKVAAVGLGAAGIGLLGATGAAFKRHGTTFEPFDPSKATALVTDGPNAVSRNPMYVGMAGVLAAHALGRGGWLTPLPVIAFVAVIGRVQIRPEEEALAALFGEDYAAYCDQVPRWIGLPETWRRIAVDT
ncbi:methyltransferase family protein [Nocardioides cavernaquae]|uniref:Isoprenylcysteine carboxylmethyltransferase family protein n=1 Tax=Nocardioides cavernaquae TaxID=2321396 RepID=A0A3A5H728_9ACTN|nr:isoprenylcysteine carboxylmethyltransferase family protein [Nocardioides cavernaquae]RJS45205.1 isoprenylcysteine carboxylmethyltransferase family protein [Nocardioides cavernaquae]